MQRGVMKRTAKDANRSARRDLMSYREFSLRKVKQDFNLTLVEGGRFLPPIEPILPSPLLAEFLAESIQLAIAMGSEKAKSN